MRIVLTIVTPLVLGSTLHAPRVEAAPPTERAGRAEIAAACRAAAAPGPEHARLAELAGTWRYRFSLWLDPAGQPVTSEGFARKHLILGGRYLVEESERSYMGAPFHGLGITGHDNATKQLVGIWLDDMSTDLVRSTGRIDEQGALTFSGEVPDPTGGPPQRFRSVLRALDHDRHVVEGYLTPTGGTEFLHLRIEYRRTRAL
jgi:hypothetical protein